MYVLVEITLTIHSYTRISEREQEAESNIDYFHKDSFAKVFFVFSVFLCPSTPYLYGMYIPIYVIKYMFLMHGSKIDPWTQFIKAFPVVIMVVFFHYLITIRELRRFYDYQNLLEREKALI